MAAAVLLLTWALLLLRQLRAERALRVREQALAAARGAEVAHLASVRIPAITERMRTGQRLDGVPGPLAPEADTGHEFARALAAVVVALGSDEAVRRERALRDSVQAAFESVARTMHAMATVQQQVLDHVEQSIDDSRLMAEVMKADHAAAQMTRKAQTLLVMCGIWPARRETRPVSLYDCVRGAQSRIVEFGRIDVHGGQTLYVVPPAVEGLMHAIAELLENATVFSPPAPRSSSRSGRWARARSWRSTTRDSACPRTCSSRRPDSCGRNWTWPGWARCRGSGSPVWGGGAGSSASTWS